MKIKCPQCSAVLVIREQAGLEGKVISCPVCKERTPFAKFIKIVEKSQEDHTQYPGEKNDDKTTYGANEKGTKPNLSKMNQIGTLKVSTMPTAVYTLKLGPNIIGRDVKSSKADWKIPGTDSCMRISREHIIVEVKKLSNGSYRHELSLYKDKVNATYVNGDRVEDKEERLILNQGDSVKLPDNIMLLFEIPDTDGTLKDLSLY